MITVAGFNTAIDWHVELNSMLVTGAVQRAKSGRAIPGGKGLHVAQMVAELGEPVRLVGLTDGTHRNLIAHHLRDRHVDWHGIEAPFQLRQCLALHEPDGRVTEILEPGAELDSALQQILLARVCALLDDTDVLVLSGSLPLGFPPDTYAKLVQETARRDVLCLVDTSGDALRAAIDAHPWLVKPNAEEAASLAGRSVQNVTEAGKCAHQLQRRGAARVVVTLGGQGAVGYDGSNLWHAWTEPFEVRNSVGSGDCFLAALAVGVARDESMQVALRRAVACGAANAANEEAGYATAEQVTARLPGTHVRDMSITPRI